jgi:endonuclease YncB( thermonuclease family)
MTKPIIFQDVHVLQVHDGDTYTAELDLKPLLGHAAKMLAKVRAIGINAAELAAPEGDADRNLALTFFFGGGTAVRFTLEVFGRDKYGRVLAEAWLPDLSGKSFSQHMLASNTVKPMRLEDHLVL